MRPVEIMIVEDSLTQAVRLAHVLEREGFKVRHATNGVEALEQLTISKPTLVLSDIVMPLMDGYELCSRIKSDESTKDIPVILITSLSDPGDVILALKAGADNFLTKPFEENSLISRIRYILANFELRGLKREEIDTEIFFSGERHRLHSSPLQMIDLLLSTYESAVQKNEELRTTNVQLKDALENISILQKNYLQLLETNADLIFVVDDDSIVRYANPSASLLFSAPGADLAGTRFPVELERVNRGEIETTDSSGEQIFLDARTMRTNWNGTLMNLIVLRDVTESVRMRRELQQLSLTDDLTGLYNRRGFSMFSKKAMLIAKRTRQKIFILFADMDGLKTINDHRGHQVGDRYLADMAQLLTDSFRESDTVARMGGDEFAVLGIINEEFVPQKLILRLEERMAGYNADHAGGYPLSVSMGITTFDPLETESIDAAVARADEAMYIQKKNRKSREV